MIHTLDPRRGGPVECVKQLGRYFLRTGHQFEVAAAADSASDDWVGAFPVKVYPLGPAHGGYAYSPRVGKWLAERARDYDVIFINGVWQAHTRTAARIASRLGVPYFVYAHGLLDPWNRNAHPIKYLKKFLYWLVAEKRTLQGSNGVVFTSAEEARLAEHYFPVSGWNPVVVGNGIVKPPGVHPEDVEKLLARFPALQGRRIWLFLSRIHSKKGIENLLSAFPAFSGAKDSPLLVIVGDGERGYIQQLKALAERLGKQGNVLWTGPLYDAEKWAMFSLAELFLLPSHQENFGIVIVESLALGVPVIITRAVNIWKTIEETGSGIVCEDSAESLKQALEAWEAMGTDQREHMSRNAAKCFETQFEIDSAGEKVLAAINGALGNQKTARRAA